jgi:hypothetical protein
MRYLDESASRSAHISTVQRILMIAGAIVFAVGLTWPWLLRVPFGALPGDIRINRPGFMRR